MREAAPGLLLPDERAVGVGYRHVGHTGIATSAVVGHVGPVPGYRSSTVCPRQHAREIVASGLTLAEAEAVFWNEVYPALWTNLTCVAGVWDGFDAQWLQSTLKVQPMRKPRRRYFPYLSSEMREEWKKVEAAYKRSLGA